MVPEGWNCKTLGKIAKWSSGGTPSKAKPEFWNGNIPWISAASMRGMYYSDSAITISDFAVLNGAKIASKGDILLLVRGSMLWNKIPVGLALRNMSFNQDVKCLSPISKIVFSEFLLYWFLANENMLMHMVTGTGIGAGKLDTNDMQALNVLLPPLAEQQKIAQILSTWDKAITTTEKLLANSQQQKKALMQQLLTGKKRFFGFAEGWKEISFNEVLEIVIGGTPSRSNPKYWDDNKVTNNRWLSIANLKGIKIYDSSEYISDLGVKNSNVSLIPAGTIVMSFKLTIGRKAWLMKDCYTNEAICALFVKDKSTLDSDFLFQALEIVDFDSEIDQAVKGKTLNKEKLKRLTLKIPVDIKEQRRIASVLLSADQQIEVLEQQLNYLIKTKNALMQQLLSGKRRVNVYK